MPLYVSHTTAIEAAFDGNRTDFAYLTLGTHHYVVDGGVRDVVQRLSVPIKPENIHLGSPIVSLAYRRDSASQSAVIDLLCPDNRTFAGFDHVVFATQANHAASLLRNYLQSIPGSLPASSTERHRALVKEQIECLDSFMYCQTVVVNHTDSSLMPDAPRDRRDLNLMMADLPAAILAQSKNLRGTPCLCVLPTYAMATHVLAGSPTGGGAIYQTTNPIVPPVEGSILSVARLERAVMSVKGKRALEGLWREEEHGEACAALKWGCIASERGVLGRLQGAGRPMSRSGVSDLMTTQCIPGVWLCGSYAHAGIPLLEGCVVSGKNVVELGILRSEGVEIPHASNLW